MKIINSDLDLLIIDKPAGVADPSSELVKKFPELGKVGGKDRGACHRLDVGTSGLLVFARNEETYLKMREAFSKNRVKKEYVALVAGEVSEPGKIEWPIGPDLKSAKKVKVYKNLKEARRNKAQEAVTIYGPLEMGRVLSGGSAHPCSPVPLGRAPGPPPLSRRDISPDCRGSLPQPPVPSTLLCIQIKTGRRHQIRAHLSAIGHPIVGDTLYKGSPADRLYLHASRLEFPHPKTGTQLVFVSTAPFLERMAETIS